MRSARAALFCSLAPLLALIGCGSAPRPGDPAAPIEAGFTFLPEKSTRTVIVGTDSIIVIRKTPGDTIISRRAAPYADSSRITRDSLYALFGTITPKTYTREGVLDGTIIRIGQTGRKLVCRNCLNDFVLKAGGKPSAWSDAATQSIRSLVLKINHLAAFDEIAARPKRDRVIIQADPAHLGDAGGKFTVKYLDRSPPPDAEK